MRTIYIEVGTERLEVTVPDEPQGMDDGRFALRLGRHLKFHEFSLPTIAVALNLQRDSKGKIILPPVEDSGPANALRYIRKLGEKYEAEGKPVDGIDEIVRAIFAAEVELN